MSRGPRNSSDHRPIDPRHPNAKTQNPLTQHFGLRPNCKKMRGCLDSGVRNILAAGGHHATCGHDLRLGDTWSAPCGELPGFVGSVGCALRAWASERGLLGEVVQAPILQRAKQPRTPSSSGRNRHSPPPPPHPPPHFHSPPHLIISSVLHMPRAHPQPHRPLLPSSSSASSSSSSSLSSSSVHDKKTRRMNRQHAEIRCWQNTNTCSS